MNIHELSKTFNISESTINNWKKIGLLEDKVFFDSNEIEKVISSKDHSRRNKKQSIKYTIPESYIINKETYNKIENIIHLQQLLQFDFKDIFIVIIKKLLGNRISREIELEIIEVFGEYKSNLFLDSIFEEVKLDYDLKEDFLGALYSSSLTVGKKSSNGIYYTPYKLVNKMVSSIDINSIGSGNKILDPACGSGNFLISLVNTMKEAKFSCNDIIESIYGYDIDRTAVFLAKINVYLLLDQVEFKDIKIFVKDFIVDNTFKDFNFIIGNPPWGIKFTNDYKETLKKRLYYNAYKQDSFALFIEKSIEILIDHGELLFVLPVSFLNVIKHLDIREKCLRLRIKSIDVLGRGFSEVVSENLIFRLEKTEFINNDSSLLYNNKKFGQNYFNENPSKAFLIPENTTVEKIIRKINEHEYQTLNKNVKYGMGLVTGNNKQFLTDIIDNNNEPIATGENLEKFYVNYQSINKRIVFNTHIYQQVAPTEIYRHNSRIIYNFIGKKIKFAYDETGLLTLNSANIICLYEGWDPYFLLAILNSRITQIYYQSVFNTYKMLRSHIESFRIFEFDLETKTIISKYVKDMIRDKNNKNYELIEKIIYGKIGLSDKEIEYLYKI